MSALPEEVPPFDVADDQLGDGSYAEPTPLIPKFEGKEVSGVDLKFSGLAGLSDDPNLVLSVDDRIRLVVVAKVSEVKHVIDKNGELQRVQTAKVVTAARVAFDPTDPNDDGVLRA